MGSDSADRLDQLTHTTYYTCTSPTICRYRFSAVLGNAPPIAIKTVTLPVTTYRAATTAPAVPPPPRAGPTSPPYLPPLPPAIACAPPCLPLTAAATSLPTYHSSPPPACQPRLFFCLTSLNIPPAIPSHAPRSRLPVMDVSVSPPGYGDAALDDIATRQRVWTDDGVARRPRSPPLHLAPPPSPRCCWCIRLAQRYVR